MDVRLWSYIILDLQVRDSVGDVSMDWYPLLSNVVISQCALENNPNLNTMERICNLNDEEHLFLHSKF